MLNVLPDRELQEYGNLREMPNPQAQEAPSRVTWSVEGGVCMCSTFLPVKELTEFSRSELRAEVTPKEEMIRQWAYCSIKMLWTKMVRRGEGRRYCIVRYCGMIRCPYNAYMSAQQ